MNTVDRIKDIEKELTSLLNPNWENGISAPKRDIILKKTRTLVNDLLNEMGTLFADKANTDYYVKNYKRIGRILKRMGYDIQLTPASLKDIEKVRSQLIKSFTDKIAHTKPIQEWFARNRIEVFNQSSKTIKTILNRNSKIDFKSLTKEELLAVTQGNEALIREYFKPRFTILNLPDENRTNKAKFRREFDRIANTLQDEVMNRIRIDLNKGSTFREIRSQVDELVSKRFPSGVVTTTNIRNGVAKVWSQDVLNYTSNWVQNTQTRFGSESCIDAMSTVGADIVEYKLGAGTSDHTSICKQLAGGSQYSLSGRSKTYPRLPQAPPASPPVHPCNSYLIPAASSIQENTTITDSMKKRAFTYAD
jgi:hypothetical protein